MNLYFRLPKRINSLFQKLISPPIFALRICLIITLCFISINVYSQISFQKIYSPNLTTHDDIGIVAHPTPDGGYILAANDYSQSCELFKTDSGGLIEWAKTINCIQTSELYDLKVCKDSGFILCGTIGQFYSEDALIIKLDKNGDTLWTSVLSTTDRDFCENVFECSDGSFIAGGVREDSQFNYHIFIAKFTSAGDTSWVKTINAYDCTLSSICQTFDNGFLVCGWNSPNLSIEHFLTLKFDSLGNIQWQNNFGDGLFQVIKGFNGIQTSDSGFIFTGTYNDNLYNSICVIKLNRYGNATIIKIYTLNNDDCDGLQIKETPDGGFVIVGDCFLPDLSGANNLLHGALVKLDVNGNITWSKLYGDTTQSGYFQINTMDFTPDDEYILTGSTNLDTSINDILYMVKRDTLSQSSCFENNIQFSTINNLLQTFNDNFSIAHDFQVNHLNVTIANGGTETNFCSLNNNIQSMESNLISISPNPSSGEIYFNSDKSFHGSLIVYDSYGQNIYSWNGMIKDGANYINLITNNVPFENGFHFLKIISDNLKDTYYSKFILVK